MFHVSLHKLQRLEILPTQNNCEVLLSIPLSNLKTKQKNKNSDKCDSKLGKSVEFLHARGSLIANIDNIRND